MEREPKAPGQQAQRDSPGIETFSLSDNVKLNIFNVMMEGLNLLQESAKDGVFNDYESGICDLKGKVLTLYFLLHNKIAKTANPEKYRILDELKPYAFGRKDLGEMKIRQLLIYFWLLKDLIDELGITRFEQDKQDSARRLTVRD